MNYLDFLKSWSASKFFLCDDDVLSVTHFSNSNYYFVEKKNDCYFKELLTLDEIRLILKVIADVYGKDSYSFFCWSRIYSKIKRLSKFKTFIIS